MSTDVATISDEEKALADYMSGAVDPFAAHAKDRGVNNQGFLRFSGNTGIWTVGDDTIAPDSQFAFNVFEAKTGWIGWQNSKPIEKIMVPIMSGKKPPLEDTLAPITKVKETDGWRYNVVIDVRDLDGEYSQMEVSLPAEHGGRPVNILISQFGELNKENRTADGKLKIPVVEVNSATIDTPGGTKYKPVLTIVDWMSSEELEEVAEQADAGKAEEEAPPAEEEKKEEAGKGNFRSRRGARK